MNPDSKLVYASLRREIEYRLQYMGFNLSNVMAQIPIQAFWTALESVTYTPVFPANTIETQAIQALILEIFTHQTKIALANKDKRILSISGHANSWARYHLWKPSLMNNATFDYLCHAVGQELIKQKVLKVGKRKKVGRDRYNPLRLRLSKKWYNENRKKEEAK